MVFKQGSALYATEVEREDGEDILYVNYLGAPYVPSIEDKAEVMSRTVDSFVENPNVSKVVFVQQRNYVYSFAQIKGLIEIAQLYNYLIKQERLLSAEKLSLVAGVESAGGEISYLLALLKQDPIGCYLELRRRIRETRGIVESGKSMNKTGLLAYLRLLERFLERLRVMHSVIGRFIGLFLGRTYCLILLLPD